MKCTYGLAFAEYVEGLALRARTDSSRSRFTYYCRTIFNPVLGFVLIILGSLLFWLDRAMVHPLITLNLTYVLLGTFLLIQPVLYRWKLQKIHDRQKMAQAGTLEISDAGFHLTCPGRSEATVQWSAFDRSVESGDLFVLVMGYAALTIPKRVFCEDSQAELKQLIARHISRNVRV